MTSIFQELAKNLTQKGFSANVGMEGAYGPSLSSNEEALDIINETVNNLNFNGKVFLAIDIAASEFYLEQEKLYSIKSSGVSLNEHQLLGMYEEWISKYPVMSIEDGLEEESWEGWSVMNSRFSDKIKIIADDLSVTNPTRVKRGIEEKAFTGCIIKPNQIGTLSETSEVINLLKDNNLDYIISHRSGETDDTFISDLAVASGAAFIKTGAPSRGERVAKYNRLLEIEREINS
ncbi:phosphopyruvate hydratase, partial [bacterium]|nr:phosphopyruvate hydratase [bacterium]